jgi:hypothetical protein
MKMLIFASCAVLASCASLVKADETSNTVPATDLIVTVDADLHDVETWLLDVLRDRTAYSERVTKKLFGGYGGKILGRANVMANADIHAVLVPGSFHLLSIADGFEADADVQLSASGDMRAFDLLRVPANASGLMHVSATVTLQIADGFNIDPRLTLRKDWIRLPDVRLFGHEVGVQRKLPIRRSIVRSLASGSPDRNNSQTPLVWDRVFSCCGEPFRRRGNCRTDFGFISNRATWA